MNRRQLKIYFKNLLPLLREKAHELGYCLAVHGSMSRDLDLIAVPWTKKACKPHKLACAFAELCGCEKIGRDWHMSNPKALNRELYHIITENFSSSPRKDGKVSSGYIELSITPKIDI